MGAVLLLLYQAVGLLAAVLASPYILLRWLRHRTEMDERLGGGAGGRGIGSSTRPLWIHAASLGELEALRSLLADPRAAGLQPFVLTVTSVGARARVEQLGFPADAVQCAPLDLFFAAGRFLGRVRPRGLILLETELWPWTLDACHRRGIPVVALSARLSSRRWGGTRLLAPLLRPLLATVALVGAQSRADAERFLHLGARNVVLTGNLKYRLQPDAGLATTGSDKNGVGRPEDGLCLFVAGSVRRGEEGVLLAAGLEGTKLILVPRHLRDREHWLRACRRAGWAVELRSAAGFEVPPAASLRASAARRILREQVRALSAPVLLVDVHGELASWYAAGDLAFVGGTLVPIGGHNLFEPAREGIPVAFGPQTAGVADLAEPLLRTGGGTTVAEGEELRAWVSRMAADPRARRETGAAALRAAAEVTGASERTWAELEKLGPPLLSFPGARR